MRLRRFTWCQCCHHGGHAGCLRSWFDLHTVCPVSGCKCLCDAQDILVRGASASIVRRS